MFTGIIDLRGRIERKSIDTLIISPQDAIRNISPGSSISVNGACLTVLNSNPRKIHFELSSETLKRTNLGDPRSTRWVNLELPIEAGGRFDGHLVYGHIDTLARINQIKPHGKSYLFSFKLDCGADQFLVEKGSVALDGISLTPFNINRGNFDVSVLPFTFETTNLKYRKKGDRVNVEFDVLAKYLTKLQKGRN